MHIHYDYTVFDMINCQEYIIAVLVKLLFFFLNPQRWQQEQNKETIMITFQFRGYFFEILVFWMNGKTAKIIKINDLLILGVIYLWKANICTADMGHII